MPHLWRAFENIEPKIVTAPRARGKEIIGNPKGLGGIECPSAQYFTKLIRRVILDTLCPLLIRRVIPDNALSVAYPTALSWMGAYPVLIRPVILDNVLSRIIRLLIQRGYPWISLIPAYPCLSSGLSLDNVYSFAFPVQVLAYPALSPVS